MTELASRLSAEITTSTDLLAGLIDGADLTRQVPACPDWTLRQLITHVGRVHRWVTLIVSTRAEQPPPFAEAPGGKLPADPAGHAGWLRGGAEQLLTAIAGAGSAPVWTHLGPAPASYWLRRMAHETSVHRADAQLAFGQRPVIGAAVAADGIDEWLGFLAGDGPGPDRRELARLWQGRSLHIHANGGDTAGGDGAGRDDSAGGDGAGRDDSAGGDGAGEWTVRGRDGRLTVERGHSKGDVALRGPASTLLLVLLRRFPPSDPGAEVLGDHAALHEWLAATGFG